MSSTSTSPSPSRVEAHRRASSRASRGSSAARAARARWRRAAPRRAARRCSARRCRRPWRGRARRPRDGLDDDEDVGLDRDAQADDGARGGAGRELGVTAGSATRARRRSPRSTARTGAESYSSFGSASKSDRAWRLCSWSACFPQVRFTLLPRTTPGRAAQSSAQRIRFG